VVEQVKNVATSTVVQNAWEQGENLTVHGWIYSIRNGMLTDLDMCLSSDDELQKKCMTDLDS
jgi:carbonic anhydrase